MLLKNEQNADRLKEYLEKLYHEEELKAYWKNKRK